MITNHNSTALFPASLDATNCNFSFSYTSPTGTNFTHFSNVLSSLVGFELLLVIHDAKLQRNRLYNDWLAYKRKLADIEEQYLFLSSDMEDTGSIEDNAMSMACLVIEFGEISTIIDDLELELTELDEQIDEAQLRLNNKKHTEITQ